MYGLLITVETLVALLLIAVILMQASTGGGLAGTIGGGFSSQVFGGRGAASFLSRLTTGLAIAFILLAVLISLVSSPKMAESQSILKQESESRVLSPGSDLSRPSGQDDQLILE
ncbi:MAG: preprotein translocase subunit SecG [Candidatus Marinimicrobia bacterium]|nr:preprotein translocase subunit SecG [Candidatus Neomarinimicrobiota bacterium]